MSKSLKSINIINPTPSCDICVFFTPNQEYECSLLPKIPIKKCILDNHSFFTPKT
jgi:hypothetical protein